MERPPEWDARIERVRGLWVESQRLDVDRASVNFRLADELLVLAPLGTRGVSNGSGDEMREIAHLTKAPENQLRTVRYVGTRWPVEERRPEVSWSVYAELARSKDRFEELGRLLAEGGKVTVERAKRTRKPRTSKATSPPPTALVLCSFCREPISEAEKKKSAWSEVVGFTPPRKGGGPNQVVFRQETGRYYHARCGDAAKAEGHTPVTPGPEQEAANILRSLTDAEVLVAFQQQEAATREEIRAKAKAEAELAKTRKDAEAEEARQRKATAQAEKEQRDAIKKADEAGRRMRSGSTINYEDIIERMNGLAVFLASVVEIGDAYPDRYRPRTLRHLRDIHRLSGEIVKTLDPQTETSDPDVIDIAERRAGGALGAG